MPTADKLNNILTAKNNIKDAIKAKGVNISDDLPFSQYAGKISEIQVGSGEIPEEPIDNPYYVEYRVIDSNSSILIGTASILQLKFALPRIYSSSDEFTYNYDKVEIELKNGSIINNLDGSIKTKDIYKIRLWYPENTVSVKFYGESSTPHFLTILDYIKTDNFTDMSYMFYYCYNLSSIDKKIVFNTSNVTNMNNMFSYCTSLTSLDVSNFDTSNVTSMQYMFHYCSKLTSLDVSNFNNSNVTSMSYMFSNCTSLTSLDLSNFNTSNVKYMSYMFYYCSKLTSLDVSSFNTSNVLNMSYMFNRCTSLTSLDLSNFNTSKVIRMEYMFCDCTSLKSLDLTNFNTSKVENMEAMFQFGGGSKINSLIIPKWDMNKTTSYSSLFGSSLTYIKNLEYIDLTESDDNTISKIVTRLYTRTKATYGEMLIPENTSQTIIDSMAAKYWKPVGPIILPTSFQIASRLDEIVGLGKSTKLYYDNYEPWYADGEIEFVSSDDTIAYINENNELVSVSYGSVEIYGRLKADNSIVSNTLTIDVSETDSYPNVIKFIAATTSPETNNYIKINGNNVKLTSMSYNSITKIYTYDVGSPITTIKFNGYANTSYGYNNLKELIKLNTSNVTDMNNMFSYCTSLTSLDLSSFDTSNVTTMYSMFQNCTSLTSLDLSSFDTSNVTTMYSMFQNCSSLTSLDLSNWDISKVINMNKMFQNCSSLTSLDLSNWDTSNVTSTYQMFASVPSSTVDWHYDGTNYQNFTLTESQTSFSGTFPW